MIWYQILVYAAAVGAISSPLLGIAILFKLRFMSQDQDRRKAQLETKIEHIKSEQKILREKLGIRMRKDDDLDPIPRPNRIPYDSRNFRRTK